MDNVVQFLKIKKIFNTNNEPKNIISNELKLSIIIPIYNRKDKINSTIKYIKEQTYKNIFEQNYQNLLHSQRAFLLSFLLLRVFVFHIVVYSI